MFYTSLKNHTHPLYWFPYEKVYNHFTFNSSVKAYFYSFLEVTFTLLGVRMFW